MGRIAASAVSLACLVACGASGSGSDGTAGNGRAIVRFEDQLRALDAAAARLADLDFTGSLPASGSAVYRGHMGATAVFKGGNAPEVVVAEIEMTARFSSGTIGGTFRNLVSDGGRVSGAGVFDGGTFGPVGIDSVMSGSLRRGDAVHAIEGTFRGDFLGPDAQGLGGGVEAVLTRDGALSGQLDGELWAER